MSATLIRADLVQDERMVMVALDYVSKNPIIRFPISDGAVRKLLTIRYLPHD